MIEMAREIFAKQGHTVDYADRSARRGGGEGTTIGDDADLNLACGRVPTADGPVLCNHEQPPVQSGNHRFARTLSTA